MFAFAFLPVVLFALEPVNLIKEAGFEKDSEVWIEHSKIYGSGDFDSTVYNRHDPDSAYIGDYCGSIDGRIRPAQNLPFNYGIMGQFYQPLAYPKKLKDLDSLELFHMVLFRDAGVKGSAWAYGTRLYFTRPSDGILIDVVYDWAAPDLTPTPDNPSYKHFPNTIANEGVWYSLKRDLKADLIGEKDLSEDIELDTFLLFGTSWLDRGTWRGQKAFFDGVRLTGYADYDVGVKEILSGDSLREGHPYTPEARIKNFGRENAPEFYVIAEVWDEETQIYYDSLPWSLDSDTEDTVSFAEFTPEHPAPYILTIRTVMEPDECDEDDELSKPLIYMGIEEEPPLEGITFDVQSLSTIRYSLPYATHVSLKVYDVVGRLVSRLVDEEVPPGVHTLRWTGKDDVNRRCASGVYFVRFEATDYQASKKMVLLK